MRFADGGACPGYPSQSKAGRPRVRVEAVDAGVIAGERFPHPRLSTRAGERERGRIWFVGRSRMCQPNEQLCFNFNGIVFVKFSALPSTVTLFFLARENSLSVRNSYHARKRDSLSEATSGGDPASRSKPATWPHKHTDD